MKNDVIAEIKRKKKIDALNALIKQETTTTQITAKSTTISENLVTNTLRAQFAQEFDKMNLAGLAVELKQERSSYGVPQFKVSLTRSPSAKVGQVLSEGEFRCIALAAFLAELTTTQSKSAIVFDDPVSSLDHRHREAVAARLATEALTRQVIVFTHDIHFLFLLGHFCRENSADLQYRHVTKRPDATATGLCYNDAPPKAQDVTKRIDAFANQQLLKAHLNCGGHAVLLSATLGSSAGSRYLVLTPQGKIPSLFASMPFDVACKVPYPVISDRSSLRKVAGTGQSKCVRWSTRDIIDSPEQVAELALAAAAQGAKVLIVRNTVPAAIATLRMLETRVPDRTWLFQVKGAVTLHHSRFSRQDRPLLDAEIELRLGKERPSGALIVVGTQTLEQSLDIDADFLITDLCPMDVVLQRVGRLHRHANERPEAYRIAQAVILTPAGNDLTPLLTRPKNGLGRHRNGGGVYDDLRVLEATRRLLADKPEVNIPDDNRYLVEAATHPARLEALQAELGEAWQSLAAKLEGDTSAEKTIGHLHTLDVQQRFGEAEFPIGVQVGSRLGAAGQGGAL